MSEEMTVDEFRKHLKKTNEMLTMTGNPLTPEDMERMVELYSQGEALEDLAHIIWKEDQKSS